VLISATYSSGGLQPAFLPLVPQITPEMFNGSPFKTQYDSLAPKPENFPALVEKLKKLDMKNFNWEKEYVKIKKPTLLVFGDSDIATIEHISDMFKKLGGNVAGDMMPLPPVQLAILPGTSHLGIMNQLASLQPMVQNFLGTR
jgi:pimeloyl-ACP methyl ester carboxylesterase